MNTCLVFIAACRHVPVQPPRRALEVFARLLTGQVVPLGALTEPPQVAPAGAFVYLSPANS